MRWFWRRREPINRVWEVWADEHEIVLLAEGHRPLRVGASTARFLGNALITGADVIDRRARMAKDGTVPAGQAGAEELLHSFDYDHLPEHLQAISRTCHDAAHEMVRRLPDGRELVAGLHKLQEANSCFLREAIRPRMEAVKYSEMWEGDPGG